jgi:glycosyltransferase involved in cell wall biosynthesis
MKIAILNNCVPFLKGGAELLADALSHHLQQAGHEAQVFKIPFRWHPPEQIVAHAVACLNMQLPNTDMVIGLKFPAYLIPHENKKLWLLHQFRQVYDLWGTPLQDLPSDTQGAAIRETITSLDNEHLSQVRKIFTNSAVTSERLKKFNHLDSEVLFPPLLQPELFKSGSLGDYIFCPGRVTSAKRQYLLAEAMAHTTSSVRLVIAGSPETVNEQIKLDTILDKHQLRDRVTFIPEFITDKYKAELMNNALGCAYIPFDEDSYGYVTLEAYAACKPVITTVDSGGILILVEEGTTGFVTQPNAKDLAVAFDRLYMDKAMAKRLGQAGYERVETLGITWDNVVRKLLS